MFVPSLTLESLSETNPELRQIHHSILDKSNHLVRAVRRIHDRWFFERLIDQGCPGEPQRRLQYHWLTSRHETVLRNSFYYGGFVLDFLHGYASWGALELTTNAIEHGSKFGRLGPVVLKILKDDDSLVFIAEDPGNGIGHSKVPRCDRGNGLLYLEQKQVIQYGREKTDEGFRSLIVYPKRK